MFENNSLDVKALITLKVVSAAFLLVCFVCLKESTFETRKNAFYFTSKAQRGNQILTV